MVITIYPAFTTITCATILAQTNILSTQPHNFSLLFTYVHMVHHPCVAFIIHFVHPPSSCFFFLLPNSCARLHQLRPLSMDADALIQTNKQIKQTDARRTHISRITQQSLSSLFLFVIAFPFDALSRLLRMLFAFMCWGARRRTSSNVGRLP